MRFLGRLLLADEPGPGLDVVLLIGKSNLELMANDEPLGDWPVALVTAERAHGSYFTLKLGDEVFVFEPRNRLSFAYDGLRAIEERKRRQTTGWRGRLNRIRTPRHAAGPAAAPGPPAPTTPSDRPSTPPQREHDHAETEAPPAPERAPAQPPLLPGPASEPPPLPDRVLSVDPPLSAVSPPADAGHDDSSSVETAADAEPTAPEDAGFLPADPFGDPPPIDPEVVIDLRHPEDHLTSEGEEPAVEPVPPSTEPKSPPTTPPDPPSKSTRTGLLDRVRRSKTEHEHSYVETNFAGGLVRRVCTECRHVSIGVDSTESLG